MYFRVVRTLSRRIESSELIMTGDFVLTILGVLPLPPSTIGQRPTDIFEDETGLDRKRGALMEIRRWYKTDEVSVSEASGLTVS
jgi:hypothetical protein